mmetsp:Transcript_60636/g.135171  ORF Transcript_60636/g.135171 Transcript_60636/m.135171 type:complete len:350 (+) Transcript_60636:206-1255(+)
MDRLPGVPSIRIDYTGVTQQSHPLCHHRHQNPSCRDHIDHVHTSQSESGKERSWAVIDCAWVLPAERERCHWRPRHSIAICWWVYEQREHIGLLYVPASRGRRRRCCSREDCGGVSDLSCRALRGLLGEIDQVDLESRRGRWNRSSSRCMHPFRLCEACGRLRLLERHDWGAGWRHDSRGNGLHVVLVHWTPLAKLILITGVGCLLSRSRVARRLGRRALPCPRGPLVANLAHDLKLMRVPEVGAGVDGLRLRDVAAHITMDLRAVDADVDAPREHRPTRLERIAVKAAAIRSLCAKHVQLGMRSFVSGARQVGHLWSLTAGHRYLVGFLTVEVGVLHVWVVGCSGSVC